MMWKLSLGLLGLLLNNSYAWYNWDWFKTKRYDVPLIKRGKSPFEGLSQFPLHGNRFRVNTDGARVFWPIHQPLVSKTYINMRYEGQKFFGMSQEFYFHQKKFGIFKKVKTDLAANVNFAIVKGEGDWVDHIPPTDAPIGLNYTDPNINEIPFSMKERLSALFAWVDKAKYGPLISQQAKIDNLITKFPSHQEAEFFEHQIQEDMESFSSDIKEDDYKNFSKNTLMCFHIGIDEHIQKEDDLEGWWVPLYHPIMGWKGFNLVEPSQKTLVTFGTVWLTVDPKLEMLNVFFQGHQVFRADIDGPFLTNMRLDVAPPQKHKIKDDRPKAPYMAPWYEREPAKLFFAHHPSNKKLAWARRDIICPDDKIEMKKLVEHLSVCKNSWWVYKLDCAIRTYDIYPCFNYFVRSSTKYGNGLTDLADFLAVLHLINEGPAYAISKIVNETSWQQFERAIQVLG